MEQSERNKLERELFGEEQERNEVNLQDLFEPEDVHTMVVNVETSEGFAGTISVLTDEQASIFLATKLKKAYEEIKQMREQYQPVAFGLYRKRKSPSE